MRELSEPEAARRALIKRYRGELWQPFVAAMKRYDLLREGETLEVRLDGGAASLVLALLMEALHRHSEYPFTCLFTASPEARPDAERLGIPLADGAAGNVVTDSRCRTDAVEALLHAMTGEGRIRSFPPREPLPDGRRLIRPLYCVARQDLARWCRAFGFPPPVPENPDAAARLETLRAMNPQAEENLFHALHAAHPDTFPLRLSGKEL